MGYAGEVCVGGGRCIGRKYHTKKSTDPWIAMKGHSGCEIGITFSYYMHCDVHVYYRECYSYTK